MPKVQKQADFLQQLAEVRDQVAALQRAGTEASELPFFATSLRGMVFEDTTSFVTVWETVLTPRTAKLSLGMIFLGDVVGSTNTGGEWQVLLDETVAASGSVPATFTFVIPSAVLDLTPYRAASQVRVRIQTRRTSGASTGGRYGGGGTIGSAPRYARLI